VPEAARKGADYVSIAAELKLLAEAADLGGTADLARRLEAAPDDHQTRFDLAIALNAEGKREAAAEQLVALMRRDRTWQDDGARKKLLDFFEAWGAKDPATLKGRRLLSALLFS
jgi:putative thioredoxin